MRLPFLLLVSLLLTVHSDATPYFLLTSSKPRCVLVTAPHETVLRIDYEAPDLDLTTYTKDPSVFITVNAVVSKLKTVHSAKDWTGHFARRLHPSSVNGGAGAAGVQTPTSARVDKKVGSVEYTTRQDGQVSVCIRASKASSQNPMRFAMTVEKASEVHVHGEKDNTNLDTATDADRHLSHMELEMKHLMASMKNIISEADFSKERETDFHQQTISMHSASMWWPIVQLCVLLLTGFTQANHVVRFLKSKRLI